MEKGTLTFTKPANPDHVSMRMGSHEGLGETIEVLVSPLRDFMERFGHDHIDILKMDIEGAEYDVLEDLIAQDYLPFTQLLVEWHWRFFEQESSRKHAIGRHKMVLEKLASKGFKVVHSRSGGQETTMIRIVVNEPDTQNLPTEVDSEEKPEFSILHYKVGNK